MAKNPFSEKDYDILDPEAKIKSGSKKGLGDLKNKAKITRKVGSKILSAIGPYGVLVLIIIIVIIGFIGFIINIPGLTVGKLKDFAKKTEQTIKGWFINEASNINTDEVIDIANYLENMNYDIVNYGFVEPEVDNSIKTYEELIALGYNLYEKRDGDEGFKYYNSDGQAYNGYYYNAIGILVNNITGIPDGESYSDKYGIVRSTEETTETGKGKIIAIPGNRSTLLKTYLISDNRIYAIRNDDETLLKNIFSGIKTVFGGYKGAWSKGLMKIYKAKNGLATSSWGFWDNFAWKNDISIDRASGQLSIRRGYLNNPMNFNISGWAPRYGLSLEFLLSLHIGTMAPDLVYAMLQNFDTEIQVYLDDAGDSEVEAKYVDPLAGSVKPGIEIKDIKETLNEMEGTTDGIASDLINSNDLSSWINGIFLTRRRCQYLLENLPLVSPDNCIGSAQEYVIVDSTNDSSSFLMIDTSSNPFPAYGINDADINETEDIFENYSVTTQTGESIRAFDATHCAKNMGVPADSNMQEQYKSDTACWLKNTADSYGYENASEKSALPIETIEGNSKVLTSQTYEDASLPNGKIWNNYTMYKYKKVKQHIVWVGEVDGEEVEFEWAIHKYLIYKTKEITETSTWNSSTNSYVVTSNENEVEEINEWVDTIVWEYIVREKTTQELVDSGIIDPETGEYRTDRNICSSNIGSTKCCKNCQKYIKEVVRALANLEDQKYSTYTPYIARVVGSWFRDTYFIIPEGPNDDAAISEYRDGLPKGTLKDVEGSEDNNKDGIPDQNPDKRQVYSPAHNDSNISSAWGADKELIKVDEEYLADSKEYWTKYEMKKDSNGNDTSEYQLYYLQADGNTSNTKAEDFIANNGYSTIKEAEDDGHAFVKKAETIKVEDLEQNPEIELADKLLWSAYSFDTTGSSSGWIRVNREDGNAYVNKVYDSTGVDPEDEEYDPSEYENVGFFYNLLTTNSVTQLEDAQRSQTNNIVKSLLKYRKYYIYDGTEETAIQIAKDRKNVIKASEKLLESKYGSGWANKVSTDLLGKYGRSALRQAYGIIDLSFHLDEDDRLDIAESWLEWQLDMYYSKNTNGFTGFVIDDNTIWEIEDYEGNIEIRRGDPRNPNLISVVNIEKSSLNAFAILENTHTIDADYQYRDFKELIVELDYFNKEDLSNKTSEIFTWLLPDTNILGWPIRPYDKQNNEYGTLIESSSTYNYLKNKEDNLKEDDLPEEDLPTEEDNSEENENSINNSLFEGYEDDQLVSSPVTGKIIEYGTHKRINIYTNEEEEVGYIILEPLTEEYFSSSMVANNSKDNDEISNEDAAKGLNLFYKEYSNVCAGYTIMIDGFDVNLEATDDEGNNGKYKQNEIMALYNSNEQRKREEQEQLKEDAPFFVNFGESSSIPSEYVSDIGMKGYYIKEGKYIGKTISNDYGDSDENPGEYIRILIKDTDYSLVENVEDFFNIPTPDDFRSNGQEFNSFGTEVTADEMEMLAAVLVAENSSSPEAMTAVCQVIKNRGNDTVHFSNVSTIADILTASGQYGTVFPVGDNNDSSHMGGYGSAPKGSYTKVYDLGMYGKFVVGNQNGRNGTNFTERLATYESKQIVEGVLSGSIADEASAQMGKLALYQVTASDYRNHDEHCVLFGELFAHNWGCLTGNHESCNCTLP